MASTKESRAVFIKSCMDFMETNKFDGIDLDWEYPCSAEREDPIKITCDFFQTTKDEGGDCTQDADNLLLLVKEMREAFGPDKIISIASQAGMENAKKGFHLTEMLEHIDHYNLMSYDYSVSDIPSANITAPNQPLYSPKGIDGVPEWGMDYTVQGYLAEGVPAEKMVLGVALYSHAWYVPGLKDDEWKTFGLAATKQEACCGPFKDTYGALYGQNSHLCGTYMVSEIDEAKCQTYHDDETQSDIAYCAEDSEDKWTKAGVWISYNSQDSYKHISDYVLNQKLKGAFLFDMSMDSYDIDNEEYTFKTSNFIADALKGATPTPPASDDHPATDDCTGKAEGHYCSATDNTKFFSCPTGAEQACPGTLVCTTSSETDVMCDWPTAAVQQ